MYNPYNARITGSIGVDKVRAIVDEQGVFSSKFIDESGYGERDVVITLLPNGTYNASCQDYDDYEEYHSVAGTWEEVKPAVKTYI